MRTIFPQENGGTSNPAQLPHNFPIYRRRELKFPVTVTHRQVKVKVYRKSAKYPFYRIAYRADGRRVVRSLKTYSSARKAAVQVAKQIFNGNDAAAALTKKEVLA